MASAAGYAASKGFIPARFLGRLPNSLESIRKDSDTVDPPPAAKKQRLDPAPPVYAAAGKPVKQEPDPPKPAKAVQWAPEGYYYVKAASISIFF